MKKRICTLLAVVMLLIQILPSAGFAADAEEMNYNTLADWNIKIAVPDNTVSVLDGEDGNYYIYPMDYGSIPYVMVRVYEGFSSEREFEQEFFTDYMREGYSDLAVVSELAPVNVGGKACYEIDYTYKVSGYDVLDRRILKTVGGTTYMFASKEVEELDLTIGDMLEQVVADSVFLAEEDGKPAETPQSRTPATTPAPAPAPASAPSGFMLTRIEDIDTGATVARCYAPADYDITQYIFSLDDASPASPACPYQIVLQLSSPDNRINMAYESEMRYLQPQDGYEEGELYYFIETMLQHMTAAEYADYRMLKFYSSSTDAIYIVDSYETSDQENEWLAERAQGLWEYYRLGNSSLGGVTYEAISCTYAERLYTFENNGVSYTTKIVCATDRIQYTQRMDIFSETVVETVIPYFYIITAPTEIFDSVSLIFDLFVLNTRVSDEFDLMRTQYAIQLCAWISNGTPITMDDDEIREMLGTGFGTYDTEQFCDYILDQNSYTTSEGRDVKISTAFDYVYEGSDGNIYAADSPDGQPAGSTRLYAN